MGSRTEPSQRHLVIAPSRIKKELIVHFLNDAPHKGLGLHDEVKKPELFGLNYIMNVEAMAYAFFMGLTDGFYLESTPILGLESIGCDLMGETSVLKPTHHR
tara:strand:- start:24169 stop:24474 length:306 start_codon:yes stop_codon:yes gene_type:complete